MIYNPIWPQVCQHRPIMYMFWVLYECSLLNRMWNWIAVVAIIGNFYFSLFVHITHSTIYISLTFLDPYNNHSVKYTVNTYGLELLLPVPITSTLPLSYYLRVKVKYTFSITLHITYYTHNGKCNSETRNME